MSKSLVVVESPAKAKTISKYLGRGFTVKASVGHIKDLPKSKLGVDVENDFAPHYGVIPGKEKVVKELRAAAKDVESVYLAADPDREGEAICQHLAEELKGKGRNIYRVLFHEITKQAIQEAFKKPGHINSNKVEAQLARRILDRLVGYKISPDLLVEEPTHAGLCLGAAIVVDRDDRMIADPDLVVMRLRVAAFVEKELAVGSVDIVEQEIRAFKSEEYWNLVARLAGAQPPEFTAKARLFDGEKWKVGDEETIRGIVDGVKDAPLKGRRYMAYPDRQDRRGPRRPGA